MGKLTERQKILLALMQGSYDPQSFLQDLRVAAGAWSDSAAEDRDASVAFRKHIDVFGKSMLDAFLKQAAL